MSYKTNPLSPQNPWFGSEKFKWLADQMPSVFEVLHFIRCNPAWAIFPDDVLVKANEAAEREEFDGPLIGRQHGVDAYNDLATMEAAGSAEELAQFHYVLEDFLHRAGRIAVVDVPVMITSIQCNSISEEDRETWERVATYISNREFIRAFRRPEGIATKRMRE